MANCLYSYDVVVFGVLKATAGSTNWEDVSTGNKIQVFAQILYGYGYWGPFALEYEKSRVDCGLYDLKSVLDEYGYVVHYEPSNLDATIASYFISELNGAMKEKLYCIVIRYEFQANTDFLILIYIFRRPELVPIKMSILNC